MTVLADFANGLGEYDTFKCLFFHGPTWDGNVPSKSGRDSLERQGMVKHNYGFAWLTDAGVEFAIKVLEMDRLKGAWERRERPPYLGFSL
jgi:hypothetical protein